MGCRLLHEYNNSVCSVIIRFFFFFLCLLLTCEFSTKGLNQQIKQTICPSFPLSPGTLLLLKIAFQNNILEAFLHHHKPRNIMKDLFCGPRCNSAQEDPCDVTVPTRLFYSVWDIFQPVKVHEIPLRCTKYLPMNAFAQTFSIFTKSTTLAIFSTVLHFCTINWICPKLVGRNNILFSHILSSHSMILDTLYLCPGCFVLPPFAASIIQISPLFCF